MFDGIIDFLRGGTMVASLAIGIVFLRFWIDSADRLFVYLSTSFILLAISQLAVISLGGTEQSPLAYLIRLLAFVSIICGIVAKNLPGNNSDVRNSGNQE